MSAYKTARQANSAACRFAVNGVPLHITAVRLATSISSAAAEEHTRQAWRDGLNGQRGVRGGG